MEQLTEKEKFYWSMMQPHHGVLYLKSKPGLAKTALLESIAHKLGLQFIDLRLSQIDPISVGQFPYLSDTKDGFKQMSFAIPEWAITANEKPTIVLFDELNRAPEDVLKAALQLFNERRIGKDFKFNDTVYMAATGNLGEADDTEVTELDSATNNRLIHVNHKLSTKEWLDWGAGIIHPCILQYIRTDKNAVFYEDAKETRGDAFATPRSWHMLSDFIVTNYGLTASVNSFFNDISKVASYYIGKASIGFINALKSMESITVDDILAMTPMIKNKLSIMQKQNSDYMFMYLINLLEGLNVTELNNTELSNIDTFLGFCNDEQRASFCTFYIHKKDIDMNDPKIQNAFRFMFASQKDLLKKILSYQSNNTVH